MGIWWTRASDSSTLWIILRRFNRWLLHIVGMNSSILHLPLNRVLIDMECLVSWHELLVWTSDRLCVQAQLQNSKFPKIGNLRISIVQMSLRFTKPLALTCSPPSRLSAWIMVDIHWSHAGECAVGSSKAFYCSILWDSVKPLTTVESLTQGRWSACSSNVPPNSVQAASLGSRLKSHLSEWRDRLLPGYSQYSLAAHASSLLSNIERSSFQLRPQSVPPSFTITAIQTQRLLIWFARPSGDLVGRLPWSKELLLFCDNEKILDRGISRMPPPIFPTMIL
jgi:hypothetical protein